MTAEVMETIREALSLRADQVTPETNLRQILRDSIDAIDLIAALSEKYQLQIDTEALTRIQTVADVAAYVEQHRGEAAERPALDRF